MDLWDWAVAAYARPDVAAACLELQDGHGQNTCLLLWAAWARPDKAADLAAAAELAKACDAAAIAPLRQARRALKSPLAGVGDEGRERLRQSVKAAELQAERLLLDSLAALTKSQGRGPILESLTAASHAWGKPAPEKALAALAAALD